MIYTLHGFTAGVFTPCFVLCSFCDHPITDSDPDLLLGILRRHGEVQLCHRVVVHGAADAEIAPWLQHQPSGARAWKLGWGL